MNALLADDKPRVSVRMPKSQQQSGVKCQTSSCRFITPIGKISLTACRAGIHSVDWIKTAVDDNDKDNDHHNPSGSSKVEFSLIDAEEGAAKKSDDELSVLQPGMNWFEDYFQKKRSNSLELLPICWESIGKNESFTLRVLKLLFEQIEFGQTVTYMELATLAGNSSASRAVGQVMRKNPVPLIIPCHRVVPSGGRAVGNYSGGNWIKVWLLDHEKARSRLEGKGKLEA